MINSTKQIARRSLGALALLKPVNRDALRLSLRERHGPPAPVEPAEDHLRRAIEWLKRAQDASGCGGVSWGYRARALHGSRAPVGWLSAYPETTGYIIETMLRYGRRAQDEDCRQRARRMADWEVSIQLPDGGIQGGRIDATPVESSTFVTGQVIFGWLEAFEEFEDERYLQAAGRAGDFLLSCLDGQGRFVRGHSHFCKAGPKAYEARTGWALARLAKAGGEEKYMEAARRMGQYAISCQQPDGWFAENDLEEHAMPLTHTIGYVLEGLMETGLLAGEDGFLDAVALPLDRIVPLVADNGYLPGRWYSGWRAAVEWSCLTGSSQIALVLSRMDRLRGRPEYAAAAGRLLGMVSATQLEADYHAGLLGGIRGSYPVGGGYGSYCVLNWATKFYADALMNYLPEPAGANRG